MIQRSIVVKLTKEGVHSWPACPYEEVSFLRYPHRHLFHIKAVKNVSHGDREIEIIMLKRDISSWMDDRFKINIGSLSCEHIAEELINKFDLNFCEVLEDNENGAQLWKTKLSK